MAGKIKVPSELVPSQSNQVMLRSKYIYDDAKGHTQEEVNAALEEQIESKVIEAGGVNWDTIPTAGSDNAIKSKDIKAALEKTTGYFVLDSNVTEETVAKTVTVTDFPNLALGGSIKIKMLTKNTAANPTLRIGASNAPVYPLYYNNERASADNSWEENEVISVYFDGTNYQASNAMGGGNLSIIHEIDIESTYGDKEIAGAETVKTLTNENLSNEEVIAQALVEFASYFNDGYYFKGVLAPNDEIGEQIGRVIFLAGKGTYENLNDSNTYVIEDGYIGAFSWNGSKWTLKKFSPTYIDSSTTDTTLQYSGEHISLQNSASYIKHMNLNPIAGSNGYEGRQGADCYGDYLFTFQKENTTCQIYNLVTKQKVADVVVEGLPTSNHNNTVCFGTQKYDPSDTYPLLYVNAGKVVRVQENNGTFTMTVVQNIACPSSNYNFVVDGDYFWRTSYKIGWNSGDYTNDGIIFKKYPLPSVQEGDVTVDTILDSFELPYIYCQQGMKINNGRAFVSYGNTYVTNSVQVVDLTTHQQVAYVSLGAIAASGVEIEDVFFYKGNLGLCYMNMVYMLKFL